MDIHIAPVLIPNIITIVCIGLALIKEKPSGSYGDGLETIFYLVPALAVSCISWMVYAVLK